ncbi:hypothetical protein MKX01_034576 [Papaver californicum]|nr:hypothetical protein MKX01_034576 [Papaver californicum]
MLLQYMQNATCLSSVGGHMLHASVTCMYLACRLWNGQNQHRRVNFQLHEGHAGVTVGENWFIVGGGDNKSGVSETIVFNMLTLVWSVLTTVQGRVPMASEGLSIVLSS